MCRHIRHMLSNASIIMHYIISNTQVLVIGPYNTDYAGPICQYEQSKVMERSL